MLSGYHILRKMTEIENFTMFRADDRSKRHLIVSLLWYLAETGCFNRMDWIVQNILA